MENPPRSRVAQARESRIKAFSGHTPIESLLSHYLGGRRLCKKSGISKPPVWVGGLGCGLGSTGDVVLVAGGSLLKEGGGGGTVLDFWGRGCGSLEKPVAITVILISP